MKQIFTLFFLLAIICARGFGQSASISWSPYTSNSSSVTPSVSGNISGGNLTTAASIGSNVSGAFTNDGFFGIGGFNWPSANSIGTNKYIQFTVKPNTGSSLTISQLGLSYVSDDWDFVFNYDDKYQIRYSTDPTFTTSTVLANKTFSAYYVQSDAYNTSISVSSGQTLYIRVYFYWFTYTDVDCGIRAFALSGTTTSSNTITTGTPSSSLLCATSTTGAAVTVPFTSSGTFTSGNVYTAQLSDASGSFANAVNIGSSASTANSGTISATVPAGTTAGSGYLIRVVASNPAVTGTSSSAITISTSKPSAVTITPSSAAICNGTVQTLTASGGTINTSTSATALSESFDGGTAASAYLPAGWARSNNNSSTTQGYTDFPNSHTVNSAGNTWFNSPAGYDGSGYCMYFYTYNIAGTGTGYLETPAMDLSAYTSATLRFYIYDDAGDDNIKVYAKQGNGSYTQVGTIGGYTGTGQWTQQTVNLSSFIGTGFNTVKLQFLGTSNSGGNTNIGLDQVTVSGTTASNSQAPISWTPTTPTNTLYTNIGATTSYTAGTNLLAVYAKPSATTTYMATATNGACTTTNTSVVTVKAVPTAVLSGTSQTVCPNGQVNLTVTFTGTAPWTVSYSDGTTTTYPSPSTSINPYPLTVSAPNNVSGSNVNYTYSLKPTSLSDASGCPNGGTSGTVAVIVKSKALATVSAAPSTICSGGQTTINFSSSTGSTITYSAGTTQQPPIVLTAGVVTGKPSGALTANTTYTITNITAPNSNYCDNTSPNGLSTTVAIQALPTVSAITVPSGGAYAQTGTSLLQLNNAPPANATGAWSSNNTSAATVSNTGLVTGTGEGTPSIIYTVTDNTSLHCQKQATQTVRVYNPDYITKAAGNFSTAATWEIDRDDATFVTTVPVPSGTNYTSIRVQHALTLNQDFAVRPGTNFSLVTGGAMTIAPGKIFSSLGTVDFGGKLVTVTSDASGTGTIGQVSSAIANASNVTVERYTDGGNAANGRRAWRLISSPITGQNIRNAWQEGGVTNTGYGTLITGESLSSSQAASAGFDYIAGSANHTSIKEYTNSAWVPLANNGSTGTNISLRTKQAYMLFVRGDRSVQASGAGVTKLRANGILIQGNQSIPLSSSIYTVVGNPYASSIDFGSLISNPANSAVIKDQFYLWNSKYGTYGAYVLVTHDGTNGYKATPSPISGVAVQDNNNYRYIPSGSGFFVSPATGVSSGNVIIREQDKVSNTPPVSPFRVVPNATDLRQLVVNLNQKKSDSTSMLADGFRAKFSADYEGNEEDNSAAKPSNFNENLGLIRNGITHIIEAHDEVKKTDTLQLRMWNMTYRSYELQLMGDNFTSAPGIKAWLEDSYLGSKQAVDLSGSVTTVGFDVNKDSGSWKSTRFRIVFENTASALPVTITKVSASVKNGGAEVNWTVSNEVNVKGYTVEKSADGRTFTTVGTQQAAKNNPQAALTNYSGYDATPKGGDNYYRIRIEGNDGKVSYSQIVKATIGNAGTGIQITLYPNPVRDGKANLILTNLTKGAYLVSVYTASGQTLYEKKVTIAQAGATQSEQLLLGNGIAQGSYQLRVSDEKGTEIKSITLMTGK